MNGFYLERTAILEIIKDRREGNATVRTGFTEADTAFKTIAHKKSLCEVTGKILFTSTSNCNIKIINNDYFTKLIKNDFNVDVEVKFDTFTYKGHYCKNDGKRYYCLLSKYTETKKNLSFIHEAYEEGDTLVVKEYYLNVDLHLQLIYQVHHR